MRKLSAFAVLACSLALLPHPAAEAQTATLVADINPSLGSGNATSNPDQLTVWGGKVLFSANTRNAGTEVWVTDGTDVGTRRITDACPGRCGSTVTMRASLKGGVILSLDSALWRSDATRAGTVPLVVGGEPLSLAPEFATGTRDFAVLGERAYFSACTPSLGCGAWRSDGTLAGTMAIGPFASASNTPQLYRAAGDRVFFVSADQSSFLLWTVQGTGRPTRAKIFPTGGPPVALATAGNQAFFFHGNELWASDGTAAGTRKLHAFHALPIFGAWIKPVGGRVYLVADDDGSHGQQIWQSDGTPDGTRKLTAFSTTSGLENLDPAAVSTVGDRLVFLASDGNAFKPWTVSPDTAPAATDLCGSRCSLTYDSTTLTPVGGRLLFVAQDAAHGEEPWTTDGTPAGTALLADTCPGSCGSGPGTVYPGSGAVFFQMSGALWRTDGTSAGTRLYSDGALYFSDRSTGFVALGEQLFFAARSADYSSPTYYDQELWTSDGTPGGTRIVTDLENGAGGSFPTNFVALGDSVYFLACSGQIFGGQELWRGSAAGGEALTTGSGSDCDSTSAIQQVVRAGQHLFLWRTAGEFDTTTLWASDGTAAGTRQVTTHEESFIRGETRLVPFQDRIYWMEGDEEVPNEVWTSDGTVAGTHKAFDLPDPAKTPVGVLAAGDALYVFSVTPQGQDFQIWRTDGTAAGLHKVFTSTRSLNFGGFAATGSSLLLFLPADSGTYELWKVDGAGGVHLRDFFGRSREVVTLGGAFYFFARTTGFSNDFGLWRSDGTAAGTSSVHPFHSNGDFEPGEAQTYATVFAGRLYFAADDGVHGTELWSSDGTAAGTALVTDLFPGAVGAAPTDLAVAGDRLFFSADDGVHGFELFESDGTAAGTRLVEDLAPEADSSYPTQMTVAGDRLYFAADDGLSGNEPWSLPLAGPAGCQPSALNLCLNGGRFKVEATWRTPDGRTGAGQAVGLSADTGYFWFFDPANVETVVKVLDGRGLNGHFWVFYGALSNVEYTLTVTDTQSGLVRHYFNPIGEFGSVGDTQAFGPLGSHLAPPAAASPRKPAPKPRIAEAIGPPAPACQPSATRLCLDGNRFAVEATWKDFNGHTGSGQAVSLTGDTGTFWFFDPSNVEVILKVLDARAVNGKFWVFYGALSNVEYTLRVTDTATGRIKTYTNPAGRFASAGDTNAF